VNVLDKIMTLWAWAPLILTGFALNVAMSFAAVILGTASGTLLGIMQISHVEFVRRCARVITELFRNAPTLVMLFMCMFLIPFEMKVGSVTLVFPGWAKAILGLALSKMGYVSEIVRGGLQSVPSTQWEAAEAMGFSRRDTLWKIIIPQCVKRMLPPWMNTVAILTMASPLAGILGVEEALSMTRSAVASAGPDMMAPFYLLLLAIFFLYTYPISAWVDKLERRYQYQA
jgi:polar amino acid transport system permease protein